MTQLLARAVAELSQLPDTEQDGYAQELLAKLQATHRDSYSKSEDMVQNLRVPGRYAGQIWMAPDFNDPLPEEDWNVYKDEYWQEALTQKGTQS